jgi:hypothetical protein
VEVYEKRYSEYSRRPHLRVKSAGTEVQQDSDLPGRPP